MPRSERLYLSDILEAAEAIQRYVAGRSFDEFVTDDVLRRAVLQRLTEIGAASAHLSRDFRTRYPDIEWTDIVAFRNIAVHAYFAVNWQIVWVTATATSRTWQRASPRSSTACILRRRRPALMSPDARFVVGASSRTRTGGW